jgi:hypothetical protein
MTNLARELYYAESQIGEDAIKSVNKDWSRMFADEDALKAYTDQLS